jgi:hypothetical protein
MTTPESGPQRKAFDRGRGDDYVIHELPRDFSINNPPWQW